MLTVTTTGNTPVSNYAITLTGTSGQLVRTATAALIVVARDFSLQLNPSQVTVSRGQNGVFTIGVQGVNGFNDTVSLNATVVPSDPSITATLSPTAISPGGSAMLTVTTTANTPLSTFTIPITGTSGQLVRTTSATLTVIAPDYSLSFSPAQVTL